MKRTAKTVIVATAALAAALAAPPIWGAMARRKPPEVVAAPPPPPPGPVALPQRSLADAAAFQAWAERSSKVSPAFADPAAVSQAVRDTNAFAPQMLIRDAVAYGAVAALQDPAFVAAVRAAGDSPQNRELMVGYLMSDPRYALLFKGSDHAAGLARQAIGQAGQAIWSDGKAVRQASYDIQRQAWSKADVADRPGRLKLVEAEGEQPAPDAPAGVPALEREASGGQSMGLTAATIPPPYPPLVLHSLQLAAIAALGEASDDLYGRLAALAQDSGSHACLHEAKLNLYQCLAVAKPNYEDVYCTGRHGMMDTGACLADNVGMYVPLDPPDIGPLVTFKGVRPHEASARRAHARRPIHHRR